jgi:hypothetical protein
MGSLKDFSLTQSFQPHYGPEVDSASNRNEYQGSSLGGKGGRCAGLTTLPPSCADCRKTLKPQPHGALSEYLGRVGKALPCTLLTLLLRHIIHLYQVFSYDKRFLGKQNLVMIAAPVVELDLKNLSHIFRIICFTGFIN